MKKLLLLFVFFISFLNAIEIDEDKTDVYFANGILTDESNATANTLLLRDSIRIKRYNDNASEMKKHIGKVKEAYNHTRGEKPDLAESGLQMFELQERFDTWLREEIGLISIHQEDLDTQVAHYKDSIKSGHKVLVVAHSQGNLFASEAYKKLGRESKNGWMQDYFEAVGIASPGHWSIKDEISISWDNDMVAHFGLYGSAHITNPIRNVA